MDDRTPGIEDMVDPGSFEPADMDLASRDPLGYPGYADALATAAKKAGANESVVAGRARIGGHEVELACFNFAFMGGSMGEVAGERLARAMERAARQEVPFVLRTATGGARMQEGMRSLIQMSKVVAARHDLTAAHQPFIAVLGHPTTGGVFASLASLADITVAEEGATIGFAGPRVAERVTGEALPEGSHTAAFAFDHGMVDAVVDTGSVRSWVANALDCLAPDRPEPARAEPVAPATTDAPDPWDAVVAARERKKGGVLALRDVADVFVALEGDRSGSRGPGLDAGPARIDGRRCVVMRAGDPLGPGEFRKALRCLDLAARLGIPMVSLVDTAGADPSVASEAQGIANLIARLTEKMLTAPISIVAIVTGEGGSGGALAFATADRLLAYETSYFSVIGPEAAAEILWRDAARAPEAARSLKLTAAHLLELGIADAIVAGEPDAASVREVVTYHLGRLAEGRPAEDLAVRRRSRWRDTW